MNPIKWLKSLFASDSPKPGDVVHERPVPKSPEPSCFAKGVAELWKRGEGWKVKRSAVHTVTENSSIYPGSYLPASWAYQCRDVELIHAAQGMFIHLVEYESHVGIQLEKVVFAGSTHWQNYSPHRLDTSHIVSTVLSHPYPALKRRQLKQAKDEATCAARLKEIETLGCPVSKSIPAAQQQPGIMKCPA